jgi:hypothetical protein
MREGVGGKVGGGSMALRSEHNIKKKNYLAIAIKLT